MNEKLLPFYILYKLGKNNKTPNGMTEEDIISFLQENQDDPVTKQAMDEFSTSDVSEDEDFVTWMNQIQSNEKGGKLEYLKKISPNTNTDFFKKGGKMKKKCKCGCNLIAFKDKGGKLIEKCACGCQTKKVEKAQQGTKIGDVITDEKGNIKTVVRMHQVTPELTVPVYRVQKPKKEVKWITLKTGVTVPTYVVNTKPTKNTESKNFNVVLAKPNTLDLPKYEKKSSFKMTGVTQPVVTKNDPKVTIVAKNPNVAKTNTTVNTTVNTRSNNTTIPNNVVKNNTTSTVNKPAQSSNKPAVTQNPVIKKQPIVYNESVETTQKLLNSLGVDNLKVDGLLGNKTKKAIMNFQKAHGLKVDGIVGKETNDALIQANLNILNKQMSNVQPTEQEDQFNMNTLRGILKKGGKLKK